MDIRSYPRHRMIWTSGMISDKSYRDSFILYLLTKLFLNSLLPKFFDNISALSHSAVLSNTERTKKKSTLATCYLFSLQRFTESFLFLISPVERQARVRHRNVSINTWKTYGIPIHSTWLKLTILSFRRTHLQWTLRFVRIIWLGYA